MPHATRLSILLLLAAPLFAQIKQAGDPYQTWPHHGDCWLLTDQEGAFLPAGTVLTDFPVLLRLQQPNFDFTQAQPHGEDLRLADADNHALHFEIEQWDASNGTAAVWVLVPKIDGNTRQRLRLYWGNAAARSESDGKAVFGAFNGYVTALHLDASLQDAVGTVQLQDQGTTSTAGMIGAARHLDGNNGIFGGDNITGLPSGAGDSTTEVWFRPERTNTTVIAWGKEQRPGKVMFNLLSPPHMAIQCYFADVDSKRPVVMFEWLHAVHTYHKNDSRIYLNGALEGAATPLLDIPKTVRLDIGGWHGHGFRGDIDEVRISNVVRTKEWLKLQYENQRELQTLVGPIVAPGDTFAASVAMLTIDEGKSATITAKAGLAQKITWLLQRDGKETVLAIDRLDVTFAPGRVTGEQAMALQLRAVYPNETRTIDVPITILDAIPDPQFTLVGPAQWDGRTQLKLTPKITNAAALPSKGATLRSAWRIDGLATVHHIDDNTLVLERGQQSGAMTISLALDNGGAVVMQQVVIQVTEPANNPYVAAPKANELPEDHRCYARRRGGDGELVCRGTLDAAADIVFLRVLQDGKPYRDVRGALGPGRQYDITVPLSPALVHYKAELGTVTSGVTKILHTADDLICGDVIMIDGQSNALATDFGEPTLPDTSEWLRTFGSTSGDPDAARQHIWGKAICRATEHSTLEIGSWGLELGMRWIAAHQVPVCIMNGAAGGTRIDQHQRNEADPTDVSTIYGRLLWRMREAKLTHGIRAILWHQGESDQGADGPTGGFGYETYRQFFIAMAAGWQRDYPNVEHTYVFQIWPKACAMGFDGSDNRLREVQRQLPRYFSRLSMMSTLGIDPPGGCHFPHAGWFEFARLIQPLMERDLYGAQPTTSITPPDLVRASFLDTEHRRIALDFDQPVVFDKALVKDFHLGGKSGQVARGECEGNRLVLELTEATNASVITYLDGDHWDNKRLLRGKNGIAALTFCEVPIESMR
jgi:hypothetical protein